MASVNQTRPHCVNKMGKTHSKPLAARHGRGTAWARHGNGMLCLSPQQSLLKVPHYKALEHARAFFCTLLSLARPLIQTSLSLTLNPCFTVNGEVNPGLSNEASHYKTCKNRSKLYSFLRGVICNVLIQITLPPASVGHRIYWIGPHACVKDGLDVATNQEYRRMFPTQLYSVTSRWPDI